MNEPHPRACAARRGILAWTLALVLAGCGSEADRFVGPGPDEGARGTLRGTLVRAEDGAPAGLLEVSLLDLASFAPIALTRADSSGNFGFSDLAPGDYLPVVHATDRLLFGLPRTRFSFSAGETLSVIYPLARGNRPQGFTLELTGRVFDALTLAPIALARVEMSSFEIGASWSEFRGQASTLEPLTDEAGRFRLGPISTVVGFDPDTQQPTQIVPSWRVTAPGYRAASFDALDVVRFEDTMDVYLVPGRDRGVITGTVVGRDGEVRVGVRVHVEWRAAPGQLFRGGSPARVLPPTPSAVSDSLGRFRLEGLPAGRFNLLAGALADDGWVGSPRSGIEVATDSSVVEAGEIVAQPAMLPLAPENGALLTGAAILSWEPVAGAVAYDVLLRRALDLGAIRLTVDAPFAEIAPPDPPFDQPSLFRWDITAYDALGRDIAITDRAWLFRYDPGTAPRAP